MRTIGQRIMRWTICTTLLVALALPSGLGQAQDTASPTAWLRRSIMYSIFVRSYRDSNGDGIGDLQGIIDSLDYIQSLGVDTIWLLPVFKAASYHGYDTIDYYTVSPDYGTNEDLIRLVKAVHERKMHILLDYVLNHTSDQHAFFKDALGNPASQYAEYFEWQNDTHTQYAGFAGLGFMPTLNYASVKVRQMALDIARYWMDPNQDGDFTDGVDGYRCDVATDIPHDFWQELRADMQQHNPAAILLGELYTFDPQDIRKYLKGDEFHAAFDFPSLRILTGDVNANNDGALSGEGDVNFLGTVMRAERNLYAKGSVNVHFINNHDTNRVASDVNSDPQRLRMATVWLLTAPDVPILYYGEEIGMRGSKGRGPIYDEYRREPFDWYASASGTGMTTWFRDIHQNNQPSDGISVQEQDGQPASLLTLYRQLGQWRATTAAVRDGQADLPKLPMGLYMVRHWSADELYITVINFSKQAQTLPLDATLLIPKGAPFNVAARQVIFSQGLAETDSATLAPAGYVVWKLVR